MKNNYLVISPCRNEEAYMRKTLDSMVAQSVRPEKWIIVDDGSTDATPEILLEYASQHPWIEIITRQNRGFRQVGPGVIDAFYEGYNTINPGDYEFVCKLDLDLDLPERYFEILISRMNENPRLGTCSGKSYIRENGQLVNERHGDETSLGMTKFYRTTCFEEIGRFVREVMWDGIDCHQCRRHGWIARSWDEPELRFEHLRPMGSSQTGILTGRMRHGFGQYFMGSSFLWMLVSAIYRVPEKPYVVGGLFILWGWLKSWVTRQARFEEPGFREFLQHYQRRAVVVGKHKAIAEIDEQNALRFAAK